MNNAITGVHPYADKFPMLPPDEIAELAASISEVGLLQPITVDPDGLILDGRNRYAACQRAEVQPTVSVYDGDAADFVIACNVTRRHMTTGARAMANALVLQAAGRRENGRWKRGSVREVGAIYESVNSDSSWTVRLAECGIVLDYKPDLAPAVVAGDITLNDAFTQADAIRTSAERDKIMAREKAKREKAEAAAEAQRNAEIVADLTQAEATKYLDLIKSDSMTPREAWAAYREATRKERERAEAERKALSQQFTRIAEAILTLSSWGEYDDPTTAMNGFEPELLNPPMMWDRWMSVEAIEHAQRMTAALVEWRKNYVR